MIIAEKNTPSEAERRSILIVEDEIDYVAFLEYAFKKAGIRVTLDKAENGASAIEFMENPQNSTALPKLILLDLRMPIMGGIDVLKWVRKHETLKTAVVIMLTSSSSQRDKESSYQAGANSYLIKPATLEGLVSLVSNFSNFWFDNNCFPQFVSLN